MLVTLMMTRISETSILTRAARHNIREDSILPEEIGLVAQIVLQDTTHTARRS
jgi:hypothetical protein